MSGVDQLGEGRERGAVLVVGAGGWIWPFSTCVVYSANVCLVGFGSSPAYTGKSLLQLLMFMQSLFPLAH